MLLLESSNMQSAERPNIAVSFTACLYASALLLSIPMKTTCLRPVALANGKLADKLSSATSSGMTKHCKLAVFENASLPMSSSLAGILNSSTDLSLSYPSGAIAVSYMQPSKHFCPMLFSAVPYTSSFKLSHC